MADKKSTRYKVTCPNQQYNGDAYGIRFADGEAMFDEVSLKNSKRATIKDADQLAKLFEKELHYTVTVIQ